MPITMSYEEWMARTNSGWKGIRPAKLRSVDYALNTYNRIPTEENLVCLRKALMAFLSDQPGFSERDGPNSGKLGAGLEVIGFEGLKKDPRNRTNAIEELFAQVVLGRRTMPFALKSDIVKVAQERIKGQIYGVPERDDKGKIIPGKMKKIGHLAESDGILRLVAEEIQDGLDCKISYGPIKTLESASRKVTDDYGGDWYQLKDGVRLTVIATNAGEVTGVGPDALIPIKEKIRRVCVSRRGLSLMKDEEAKPGTPGNRPKSNPVGYSGLNFVLRLNGGFHSPMSGWYFAAAGQGWPGEIQANIPAMMFGKMSKEDMLRIFSEHEYDALDKEIQIKGGIGHVFYEMWRVDRTGRRGQDAAELGGRYHDYLRNPNRLADGAAREKLRVDIEAFMRANPTQFGKH